MMRATRDLLRRRLSLTRKRADRLGQVQNTHSPYTLPEIGKKLADKANRTGGAERFPAPAVPQIMAVDLALIGSDAPLLRDLEFHLVPAAKQHDAQTIYLLQTVPGLGKILRLVLLYAIHASARCPSVHAVVSSGRVVTWAKESAGKRAGTSGTKIGQASLQWAFSEAAGLVLRDHPAGQKYRARLENKQGTGQALTILAHQRARAVYSMLQRRGVCEGAPVRRSAGRGAGEPAASLGHHGWSLRPRARS